MKCKLALLTLICMLYITAHAQDKQNLDAYFSALANADKFMGQVTLSQNGKTIYKYNTGIIDEVTKAPINDNTKFRIGSITKTYTAAMVMKAVDQNKLQLTDKLAKFFPEVPNAQKITIAQLLAHRSGIHNFTADAAYEEWQTSAKSDAEMLAIIVKGGSDFDPGSKAEYSNSNYVLLSQILQTIYKKPYRELLTQQIIQPLGLSNTFYGGKINTRNNEAKSFSFGTKWSPVTETDMAVPSGAGAIVSTSSDVSRFMEALFSGKVISAKGLEQMKAMQDNYGMGLFEMNFNGKNSYGHTGGIDAFSSVASHFPDEKLTIAVLSNGLNYDINSIGLAMLSWYFNKSVDVPTFTTYSYQPAELSRYAGIYSSPEMPLKITVSTSGNTLTAQATGQSAFPLEASALHIFKFDQAGIVLEFNPDQNQMILKQGGGRYTFTKG